MYKCPDCGKERNPKAVRCIPCSFSYEKEKQRIKNKEERDRKRKTDLQLICRQCNQIFMTNQPQQKFCRKECSDIHSNLKSNERWIERNLEDRPKPDNDKIEYARVRERKGQGWLKKFNSV